MCVRMYIRVHEWRGALPIVSAGSSAVPGAERIIIQTGSGNAAIFKKISDWFPLISE